jgi:hypothetical protein
MVVVVTGGAAMDAIQQVAMRKKTGEIEPYKLEMLTRVFDVICLEAGIPKGAEADRVWLAEDLVNAAPLIDDEATLLIFARNSLAESRRKA